MANLDELITRLRDEVNFNDELFLIPDNILLEITEGTFLRARIELRMAMSDLWKSIKQVIYHDTSK